MKNYICYVSVEDVDSVEYILQNLPCVRILNKDTDGYFRLLVSKNDGERMINFLINNGILEVRRVKKVKRE